MTIDTDSERKLYAATTQKEWDDFRGGETHEDQRWADHAHNIYHAMLAEIDKGREAQDAVRELGPVKLAVDSKKFSTVEKP